MGQQQKLLYVAGLIIVGAAILIGIQKFESSYKEANIDALTLDLIDIAARIQAHCFRPEYLAGSNHSFSDLAMDSRGLEKLYIKQENVNGTFKILNSGNDNFLIIQGIGKNDYDGDGVNLTIQVKVYADSVETVVVNY